MRLMDEFMVTDGGVEVLITTVTEDNKIIRLVETPGKSFTEHGLDFGLCRRKILTIPGVGVTPPLCGFREIIVRVEFWNGGFDYDAVRREAAGSINQ